jgi:mRNA-degrading endonuclease RelE of RelBE toxin-antitoxin system
MSIKVVESAKFSKDIKNLKKRYKAIESGDRITGNKYPVYQVRIKNSDIRKGQSGGYRVIYYIQTPEAILLIKIYSKSDRANISNEEIEEIIDRYLLEFERKDTEFAIDSESPDLDERLE